MGSLHCVSMCGGLVTASVRTRMDVAYYHVGRLMGYCALGAAAGALGKHVLISASQGWIAWISSALVATALVWLGIRVWRRKPLHFSILPRAATQRLLRWTAGKPYSLGAASAFLPCGWLHTFVLAAVTTQSATKGAAFLFAFWLGTLPAMISAPLLIHGIARPLARFAPKATAILLIAAGLSSLALKSRMMMAPFHMAQAQAQHGPATNPAAEPAEMKCH